MKNDYDRYTEPSAPDLRETKTFEKFCDAVLAEIRKKGKNATYGALTGKDKRFYRVSYHFNLAIECLTAQKRITTTTRNGVTVFQIAKVEAEPPKPTKAEYYEKSSAAIFGRREKGIYPSPSSFPQGVK